MDERTFEIGLVGAGAISAGAYTGGVIDFMVHALDCWYAAKGIDSTVPPHDVKLSVMSGASAGGIMAALAAAYLGSDQPPVTNEQDAGANHGRNKLFDSWVERIDMSRLLQTRDLDNDDAPVISLLDSTVLPEIADNALDVTPHPRRRAYVAENFELLLTVTNLRGVPYAFDVVGDRIHSYDMSLHADYMHFRVNDTGSGALPDRYTMSWSDFGRPSSVKETLKMSALASGAFPLGLAPRVLTHTIPGNGQPDWYSSRKWSMPTPDSTSPHRCTTLEPLPANFGNLTPGYRFDFQCVDGGVMNNEPLELARQVLLGGRESNPRPGDRADKAILLIDPFPSESAFDPAYSPVPDLLKSAFRLFGALKNQARFKPDELVLAARKDVYSRFMIAPSRDGQPYPIACGSLAGFGGFLKRSFRAHDYFLGRRNAQKFLKDHFVLLENNPLFTDWNDDMRRTHCVKDAGGNPKIVDGQRLLPVIPVVGAAAADCHKPKWPSYTPDDLDQLLVRVEGRISVVLDRLVKQYFKSNSPLVRLIARIVMNRKKKDVVGYVGKMVTADLKRMGLMT